MALNSGQHYKDGIGLSGVSLFRAGRHILRDVTLHIAPGEFHALAGSKNSGKSAICAVLTGEMEPDSGTVRIGDKQFPALTKRQVQQFGISSVGGEPRVFPRLTVGENLLSGERRWLDAIRPWRHFVRDLHAWLDRCGIDLPLSQPLESLPDVDWVFVEMLGRLYQQPSLLLLDEALESLTPARRRQMLPLIRRSIDDGMSVLWVTHKVEDALLVVDRLSVVRNGDLLITTPPGGIDQLSLIQLCYAQIEELEDVATTSRQFQQLMRFTDALIKDLPQAVAILDSARQVAFINRQASRLFVSDGRRWRDCEIGDLLGERNSQVIATVVEGIESGEDCDWHNLAVRHDAGEMLADVTLRRVMELDACVGYMVLIEDVSAREQLRSHAILSDNLASVGLLAAGVAHEVNNPLEIMGNYLTFLKGKIDDENQRKILAKMEDESARIQQIVRNLVVFSGTAADTALVDLPAQCLELCELLRFHNQDKRIVIECQQPEKRMMVRADRNEIRQVLLNLFRNAIDALRDGGKITVEFESINNGGSPTARMRISDNGPGITLANPADIFLPFVTTRKTASKNHGLGLFIVYNIIQRYEGNIMVENRPEGGCRFTINLPLAM
ncbi:MAG: ATP-binding cassette domain-containing protein [Planctomycetes bacterium]|nr:ATP-binding cassette domain-containing protein [Planctomycetota bacterium]